MTYTTNTNDDLLDGNEWDEFTSDILEEFEEKKGGGRRGCLRVIILLLLIVILLAAGAYYVMNRPTEEDVTFEDESQTWLENASTVVTNYETAIAGETMDCTAVLGDDEDYLLGSAPDYDGSDDDLTSVRSLMTDIDQQIKLLRTDISRVCGNNESISNEGWVSIARPEGKITNARNFIQQAEDLLGTAE